MAWGDKGEVYRPDICMHGPNEGCMWCCEKCNKDTHKCPKCGTVADHDERECNPGRPCCYHSVSTGCMNCCEQCNLDRHLCGGCGTPVDHGKYSCEECKKL